jgi:hypothetical protein
MITVWIRVEVAIDTLVETVLVFVTDIDYSFTILKPIGCWDVLTSASEGVKELNQTYSTTNRLYERPIRAIVDEVIDLTLYVVG